MDKGSKITHVFGLFIQRRNNPEKLKANWVGVAIPARSWYTASHLVQQVQTTDQILLPVIPYSFIVVNDHSAEAEHLV